MTSGNGSSIRRNPHEIASAEIAKRILEETGFTKEESDRILFFAILSHRGKAEETENAGQDKWQLAEILYDADKISVRVIRVRLRRTVTGAEKRRIRKSSGRKRGMKMRIGNKEFDTAKHIFI